MDPCGAAPAAIRHAVAVCAICLGLLLSRLPALVQPLDIDDEGIYAVVASELMQGERLYTDVVDRKPPLLYGAYELVLRLAGTRDMTAIHAAAALWTLLTMAALAWTARRLFGGWAGAAAAVLYGVYSAWGPHTNLAWNGEMLTNLPIALALAIAFHRGPSRARPGLLAAGGLLGCAFLLKQPGGSAALPLGLYLLLPSYRRARDLGIRHSLLHAAFLTAGFVSVVGVVAVLLWARGTLADAIYWGIRHHDMPHGPADVVFWERLAVGGVFFALACLPLVTAARASLGEAGRSRSWSGREAERTAILLLLGAAFVGVSASGRFYFHYFILLVPGLCLAAAPVVGGVLAGTAPAGPWPLRRRTLGVLLAATAIGFPAMQGAILSGRHPIDAARFVREHSDGADRIFVWGELPRVYWEAGRRPASRYVSCFPLTGYPYGGAISYEPGYPDTSGRIVPGAWETLERDLAGKPPRFIVDVEAGLANPRYPIARFPLLARLVADRYRLVHVANEGLVYERRGLP